MKLAGLARQSDDRPGLMIFQMGSTFFGAEKVGAIVGLGLYYELDKKTINQ